VVALLRESLRRDPFEINWRSPGATHNQDGYLHVACRHGNMEAVRVLLRYPGIEVDLRNSNGSTGFILACRSGNWRAVLPFLRDQRCDMEAVEALGRTGLWFAAYFGHREVVEVLLAGIRDVGGEETGVENNEEFTPRQVAKKMERRDVVEVFNHFSKGEAKFRKDIRNKRDLHKGQSLFSPSLQYALFPVAVWELDRMYYGHCARECLMSMSLCV